ncbi:MAG: ABC transporter ATP-binding protein [Candidatus Omnitrophica bacterium]|nr:ABC transporter ATP-binding protein [Candidatus Omnitrophota bacterium]
MLEAKNIHKVYSNGKKELRVLKGVSLTIERDSFTAITGPSGAGKSTLLHILGGLDAPSEGKVSFKGEDLYALGDAALAGIRNKRIGFVFQFYHLLSEFSALENVFFPGLIDFKSRSAGKELKKRAVELLKQVGLGERMGHFPAELSGGEKQRVAIARSLMNAPELLLCDEPTGNLDSETGNEIIGLIKKINRESLMTVLLVTHNRELAASADKVYYLRDGSLVD